MMKINEIKLVTYIFITFFLLRLSFIFIFPPFTDETNYILWGERYITQPSMLFSSAQDWRKQPLPFWVFGFASLIFKNPIIGARLLVLLFGIFSFFFLYDLTKKLSGKETALLTISFLSFSPLFVFFQSLSIMDPLLFSLNILLLWIIFKLKKQFTFQYFAFLALTLGISLWIKNTAIIMAIITSFTIWYLLGFKKFILLLFLAIMIIFPLILRGDYALFIKMNKGFTLSFEELLRFPFGIWVENFIFFIWTSFIYLTPIPFLFLFLIRKNIKSWILLMLTWFLVSIFGLILTSKFNEMRYYFFAFAPILPVFGFCTNIFLKRYRSNQKIIIVLIFCPIIILSLFLILKTPLFFAFFPKNSIVKIERDYATYWPSAYRISEAIDFFESERLKGKITILALVSNGSSTISSYLGAYYRENNKVQIFYFGLDSQSYEKLHTLSKTYPIFIIINNYFISPDLAKMIIPLKIFEKEGVENYTGVYRFK